MDVIETRNFQSTLSAFDGQVHVMSVALVTWFPWTPERLAYATPAAHPDEIGGGILGIRLHSVHPADQFHNRPCFPRIS